jgi:hypothetical protein
MESMTGIPELDALFEVIGMIAVLWLADWYLRQKYREIKER